ncbi:MAG: hypothetical protein ACUVRX_10355, partial [Actinomycetota bacterium]
FVKRITSKPPCTSFFSMINRLHQNVREKDHLQEKAGPSAQASPKEGKGEDGSEERFRFGVVGRGADGDQP